MLQVAGLAIAIGGALGNLWDRLEWSFVFDWILIVNRSVINLADIAIALGLLLYFLARTNPPVLDVKGS
jgi:signal peptidase II